MALWIKSRFPLRRFPFSLLAASQSDVRGGRFCGRPPRFSLPIPVSSHNVSSTVVALSTSMSTSTLLVESRLYSTTRATSRLSTMVFLNEEES